MTLSRDGCVPHMVALAVSTDPKLIEAASRALSSMSRHGMSLIHNLLSYRALEALSDVIMESGALPVLVQLLTDDSIAVQLNSLRALEQLTRSAALQRVVIEVSYTITHTEC